MPDLSAYLDRIGYHGAFAPDLRTLVAVHRAQALSVPYDGIDVYRGIALDHSIEAIFDKIVRRRRGGWCYETNGLLGWALKKIGFDVVRATSAVYRSTRGDSTLGNHVVLLVRLEQTYLADLGLGDALRDPIALREGTHQQGPLSFRLEKLADGYWRFHNHALGSPTDFDFRDEPADEALLAGQCAWLQRDPESFFLQNFECIKMQPAASSAILGRVLRHTDAIGVTKHLIASPEEMTDILRGEFGLTDLPINTLWQKILARHAQVFGTDGASMT